MIELNGITKKYNKQTILENFSIKIEDGDFLCIYGESGSGKTTLLNILGLLEKPNDGEIIFDKEKNINEKKINYLQRNKIGYLFQNFGLLTNETVKDNLLIALKKNKINKHESKELMLNSLQQVNLPNILEKKIFELSGGEQQRVALARILLKQPKYIFADEPTGNLDEKNSDIVFHILNDLNKNRGITVVFVTHNKKLIELSNNVLKLKTKNSVI
ncbi:ATP-binding cassette domain-containing protein [Enterococcus faecium]|uniref:ABC transporter ATP-binding protein n=1 Tax=Enterococcus faecium TaxID=1352 RepID=UPI003512D7E8